MAYYASVRLHNFHYTARNRVQLACKRALGTSVLGRNDELDSHNIVGRNNEALGDIP